MLPFSLLVSANFSYNLSSISSCKQIHQTKILTINHQLNMKFCCRIEAKNWSWPKGKGKQKMQQGSLQIFMLNFCYLALADSLTSQIENQLQVLVMHARKWQKSETLKIFMQTKVRTRFSAKGKYTKNAAATKTFHSSDLLPFHFQIQTYASIKLSRLNIKHFESKQ